MHAQTTFYLDDEHRKATTIVDALMPPVGAKIVLASRGYIVSEPPEIYVNPPDGGRGDDEVSIYITVKEG